jgi:chromate reductase
MISGQSSKANSDIPPSSLNVVVLLGSTRADGPPFPAPLGRRVGKFIVAQLTRRGNQVTVIDPIEEQLELLRKPQFAYAASKVPVQLANIAKIISAADAYVVCTPEYNHSPSPALLNLLVNVLKCFNTLFIL